MNKNNLRSYGKNLPETTARKCYRTPSISVKKRRKSLWHKELRLQRYDLAFRHGGFADHSPGIGNFIDKVSVVTNYYTHESEV